MPTPRTTVAAVAAALGACTLTLALTPSPARSTAAAAVSPLWVGAFASGPAVPPATGVDSSLPVFDKADQAIGPLRVRRCFDPSLPATFHQSCARDDWAHGYRSFVSWKPPGLDFAGTAAGRYDTQITTWATSVPPHIGLYATVWHEPEDDLTGSQFVAMYRHVYAVVKAVNPSISFGPVHMAYWWEEGSTHYAPGGPDAWWVWSRYADFVGVDTYSANPTPLRNQAGFQGWLSFVNRKAPTKRLVVAEYGQGVVKPGEQPNPASEAARARIIAEDESYLRSIRFTMWLVWHGVGPKGDWRLTDPASQAAWRTVASHGRRS